MSPGYPKISSRWWRVGLAWAYQATGRPWEAIAVGQYERALAEHERTNGRDHAGTIAARASLASAFRAAGKHKDAIAACEQMRGRSQGLNLTSERTPFSPEIRH